jgi:hypothetical protein
MTPPPLFGPRTDPLLAPGRIDAAAREARLRAETPLVVNAFNQLTYVRDTVGWAAAQGFRRILVLDQASDYPPLLDYYASAGFRAVAGLIPLGQNLGPRAFFSRGLYRDFPERLVYTDPDLALPDPPAPDLLTRLVALAERHRAAKVGLAIEIPERDALKSVYREPAEPSSDVIATESRHWGRTVEPGVHAAALDTTFHLFSRRHFHLGRLMRFAPVRRRIFLRGLRVAGPGFTVRHRPWYAEDGLGEAEREHYRASALWWSTWARQQGPGGG